MGAERRGAGRGIARSLLMTAVLVWEAGLAGGVPASAQVVDEAVTGAAGADVDTDATCDTASNVDQADAADGERCGDTPGPVPPRVEAVPPPSSDAVPPHDAVPPGNPVPPGEVVPPSDAEPSPGAAVPPQHDTQAPVLRVPQAIVVDADDADGAVVRFKVTATDNGVTLAPACAPQSGTVFPVGATTVTCTTTDAAGNVASSNFDVTVRPPVAPSTVPPVAPSKVPPTTRDAEPPPDLRTPVAADDGVDTVAGVAVPIAFLANDTQPGGKAEVGITAQPASGSVELLEGLFRYTPQDSFVGSDSLSYRLCRSDLPDRCDSGTVTIHVHPAKSKAQVALAEPVWQTVSQRASEALPRGCAGALAWGGFANGHIFADQMVAVGAGHLLEPAAASAFAEMRAAAQREGIGIPLTDSYRNFAAQVELRQRKGASVATATPGTSVHGWGKAVDVDLRNPALRPWLDRNAARFGWVNPIWAKRAGMSFEPWHYEFYGSTPGTTGSGCAPAVTSTAAPAGLPAITLSRPSERPEPDVILETSVNGPEGAGSGSIHTSLVSRDQAAPAVFGLLASVAFAFGLLELVVHRFSSAAQRYRETKTRR
ncbi:MAG: D-alanyl-D-alanine carboxypeptidase family protein [Egibacteraceae bacterium]